MTEFNQAEFKQQQQAIKHWQVVAEATLSQLDLLRQVPRGEQLTPDLFQQLLIAEFEQLRAWKDVAQYACHRLNVSYSADAVPSKDSIADAVVSNESPSFAEAIVYWAEKNNVKLEGKQIDQLLSQIELMLCDHELFTTLIYRAAQWEKLAEWIESQQKELGLTYLNNRDDFEKLQAITAKRYQNELDVIAKQKAFQEDVLVWMRSIAMIAETLKNGSHREKEARIRGMIELIETSIERIREEQESFTTSHWQRPDIFRSDYPVQRFRERIRELKKEVDRLKGYAPAVDEDSPF